MLLLLMLHNFRSGNGAIIAEITFVSVIFGVAFLVDFFLGVREERFAAGRERTFIWPVVIAMRSHVILEV